MTAVVTSRDYRAHFVDPDGSELSKLLDMKGIKRSEQSQIIELFRDHQRSAAASAEEKSGGRELYFNSRF